MRLLIVDDEHYIVNYLASLIEEEDIADLEVLKSYSGPEAINLIQTSLIDLVLLDIHMPGMSGLEVAKQISEYSPRCRIIFLTAYDDFNHIYESNKLKNSRYLLKAEEDKVILSEISRTLSELEIERTKMLLLSEAQKKSLLLAHLLQQNILQGIMAGYSIEKLERELSIAGSDFKLNLHRPIYLMYAQVHYETLAETTITNSLYILEHLQLLERMLDDKFEFSMLDFGKGNLLILFQPIQTFVTQFEFLQAVANDFSDYYLTKYNQSVTSTLYPYLSDWDEICTHFHLMQQYVDSSVFSVPFVYSSSNVFEESSIQSLQKELPIDRLSLDRKLQELSFYLNQGSEKEFLDTLKHLSSECIAIRNMHSIPAIKIYSSISLMIIEYIDLHQLQDKVTTKIALYPLYQMNDFSSWNQAFLYLDSLFKHIFDILNSTKLDRNEQLVKKIKNYIRNNLADSLTLTTISRVVHYNEAYISRLFKQINGIGVSEYISLKRINKAKELLVTTTESMQNIATTTGFDTAQYFSIVFKKTTGISPSEYRRDHLS